MERIGLSTLRTGCALIALVLGAVIASPAVGLAQTVTERAVAQAQTAVKAQIARQENIGNLTAQFADTRTDAPSPSTVRVRGTGTALRPNQNGQARPFSYDALVNTRTSAVTTIQYNWRGGWYADDAVATGTSGSNSTATNSLTGMYRLNTVRSDNTATIADRVTNSIAARQRNRLRNQIMQRLESPETLAIERNGQNITMGSSLAREVAFNANGQQQVEQTRQGQTIRSSATLTGERLVVATTGDRTADYQVSFEPIERGRSLRVTRRVSNEGLGATSPHF